MGDLSRGFQGVFRLDCPVYVSGSLGWASSRGETQYVRNRLCVANHPVDILASVLEGLSLLTQSMEVVCSLSFYSSYQSAFDPSNYPCLSVFDNTPYFSMCPL